MKRSILVCVAAVALAGSAFAQNKDMKPASPAAPAQGGMMDMSKMGPGSRKPTNEAQTKKDIEAFFKKQEEAMMKGDMEASWSAIDFPIFMLTDDQKGTPEGGMWDREQYIKMMKPMMENMPKDMKMTHKPTITVLSDSLAAVTDNFTMTMGKQKMSGTNAGLLVKRDGQWKWKSMVEAGWGGMSNMQGAGGGGQMMPTEGKK